MTDNYRELIVEARELVAHTKTYNFGMWAADRLAHEVAGQLADALEALLAERDEILDAEEGLVGERDAWGERAISAEAERDELAAQIAAAKALHAEVLDWIESHWAANVDYAFIARRARDRFGIGATDD